MLAHHIAMMDEGIDHMRDALPGLPATEARLTRLMLVVGERLQAELASKLKPHRLNDSEFLTLMILRTRPDGCSTPGELCEFATQGATNMTRITNALAARGLIKRDNVAGDRRRVAIQITPAGLRFVEQLLPPMFPRVAAIYDAFSAAEKRQLDRLLRKLAAGLDALDDDAG